MSYHFKLELNERSERAIYAKGVLDVRWHPFQSELAVTYDPYLTDIQTVMKTVLKYTGGVVVIDRTKAKPDISQNAESARADKDEQR